MKTWQSRYPQEDSPIESAAAQNIAPAGRPLGAEDAASAAVPTFNLHSTHDTRDFRDNGTMNKVHPNPNHWSREDRQDDFYQAGGRR